MARWFGRGICPECQRTIGGRGLGQQDRSAALGGPMVELSRHKTPDGKPCNGGKRIVAVISSGQDGGRAGLPPGWSLCQFTVAHTGECDCLGAPSPRQDGETDGN